jgi:ABC-type antimicrobial peptide transport system permease subunit
MRVFELQLTDGRWFDGGTDESNVILNETAVRELKIPEPYIGQRFDFFRMKGNIIGIVKDFHFQSMHEKITPLIIHQNRVIGLGGNIIAIKTQAGKHAEAVSAVETVWNEFFPNDPFEYVFLDDAFNRLYRSDLRTSQLMLVFSILAIVIAALGLFGLSTFAIERRAKEIGIRKVLGASAASILQLLTREFLVLVVVAFAVAVPVAWWVMNRWLDNFAYRIHITVWIFVFGAAVTLLIALAAIGIQAIKAATENPVEAIKSE